MRAVRTVKLSALVGGAAVAGAIATAAVSAGHPDGGNSRAFRCVPADAAHPGPGHFRFNTSACENATTTLGTLPLHRGTSHGQTVWYVVMDSSSQSDASARGVNYAPRLANLAGTPAAEVVQVKGGVIDFPATVQFNQGRVLVPGPNGFPPSAAAPPAVGEPGYSPYVVLPGGTVINAPQIANASGRADKVVDLDVKTGTAVVRETEGRYEDKHVHYMSFDSSNPTAAAIEDVTYAPSLGAAPTLGDEGPGSARLGLIAVTNGPTGALNPQRQGLNSAILDGLDPHNMLHDTPVLPMHASIGSLDYTPAWDVRFAQWTQEAIDSGERVELRSFDEAMQRVADGLITGFGGAPFGPVGIIVNCPLVSIDVA